MLFGQHEDVWANMSLKKIQFIASSNLGAWFDPICCPNSETNPKIYRKIIIKPIVCSSLLWGNVVQLTINLLILNKQMFKQGRIFAFSTLSSFKLDTSLVVVVIKINEN